MNIETAPKSPSDHDKRIYRMMLWVYLTVLPAALLFFLTAPITDSLTLYVNLAWYSISFVVQTFSLYVIRQSLYNNFNRFSFGTGKLENFSAFLDGLLCIPVGLYLVANAVDHLFAPAPVGYALGMVPFILSGIRLLYFSVISHRLMRETDAPSPILQSYTISFRIGLFSNLGVLLAFLAGWGLVRFGLLEFGNRIDPAIALLMALYMIIVGFRLVWQNLRSLMDLPLTENEQLIVMRVLANFYDEYDGIGIIYTRMSGKEKFVELELFFHATKTLGEIQTLQGKMELALASELPKLRFRILPLIQTSTE